MLCSYLLINNRYVVAARTVINGGSDLHIELELKSVGFCERRKTGEPGEKPSEQDENQRETERSLDGEYGNRTRVTGAGGERLSTAPTMLLVYLAFLCASNAGKKILQINRNTSKI